MEVFEQRRFQLLIPAWRMAGVVATRRNTGDADWRTPGRVVVLGDMAIVWRTRQRTLADRLRRWKIWIGNY